VRIYQNKLLGEGATAQVFEGLYTYPDKSQRQVAVKCIKKSLLTDFGPDFIEKLESELHVLS
jgi:hypothetical protein